MAGQLVPIDTSHFAHDRSALVAELGKTQPNATVAYEAFNPYPWVVTADESAKFARLSEALRRAARAVVENYFSDARLREIIALEPKVIEVLRLASSRPYELGAIRPDFLHALDGEPIVNEINARFPLNGFLVSEAVTQAIDQVPYRSQLERPFELITSLDEISRKLESIVGSRDSTVVVKGAEHGYDMRMLVDLWKLHDCVSPAELTPEKLGERFGILELHQHELLKSLPGGIIELLARRGRCLNDLRTIFLVHDKRLLAVMSGDVLRDYIDGEALATLHQHVAKTVVISHDTETRREALAHPAEWVLKPHLLGKAEGIVIGSQVSADAWRAAIESADPRWVLQRFVRQRTFPILSEIDGEVATRPMSVIGVLPSLNETFFGPGIYRAGAGAVVNVAGGGTILTPVVSKV